MVDVRACLFCGTPIEGRKDKKFCSSTCRGRWNAHPDAAVKPPKKRTRKRTPVKAAPVVDPEVEKPPEDLAANVSRRLADAGRLNTVDGQQAVLLARQLGAKVVNTSGLASLSKEFSRVMAVAMAGVEQPKGDKVDEIAERRERKRAEAQRRAAARRVHAAEV